jgi:glycosyltransferase involved in cell wall biosynthesis
VVRYTVRALIERQAPDSSETPAPFWRPGHPYRPREGGLEPAEVSIVTVVEAGAEGFADTARSVLGQSFPRWEWIVVNRAPADARTLAALAPYRGLDRRIRIVDGVEPDGRAATRYVLGSGACLEPTAIERHLWQVATNPEPRPLTPYETVRTGAVLDNPLDKGAGVRRVLLLFPRLVVGGADTFTLDLVAQLAGRSHEVTVCTTMESEAAPLDRLRRLTPDVFVLPAFLRPPDYPRFLLYLVDSRAVDVIVVSHSYLGYQLLPFLRAWRPHVACVDYAHLEAPDWNNGGYPRAGVACQELLDLNVVSTQHLKDWMVARGAHAGRIEVVHTNVDTARWAPDPALAAEARAKLGLDGEGPLVLYAGRLTPRKQPRVFGEVVRRLADNGVSFEAVVAGDGEERPALAAFLAEHGLDARVRLLGEVSPERMRELQAAADIFFLPSRLEGLSVALFEAMAMATVPVTARVGGHAELVTPDCGHLVTPGDGEVEAYVQALSRLIASPELRRAMGRAARRRVVESFTLDAMGERMVEALGRAEKLCAGEPRAPVSRALGLESATLAVEQARLEGRLWALTHAQEASAAREAELARELAVARAAARPAGGEVVRRLSAAELSRHLGARTLLRALGLRLAWRAGLGGGPPPTARG